jgi:two-component system cell cycle response regulator
MTPSAVVMGERHLQALWAALRDALDALGRGDLDGLVNDAKLVALAQSLVSDARRFSEALEKHVDPVLSVPLSPSKHPPASRPRVLVVDDEPRLLDEMTALLSRNYEVTGSLRAIDAAQLARERCPDAVVADLCMPGVDGLGLLDLLRANAFTVAPPLLVISPQVDVLARNQALERGAFDCLGRPIDEAELMARLSRAVQYGQQLKREHTLQLTDDLTGVYNRRALHASLQDALQASSRRNEPVALALVDQDGLKQLNDRFGHAVGDQCIVAVAKALLEVSRATDVVVRHGGDEFAVVMPNTTLEGAQRMLERATALLSQRTVTVGPGVDVQVTFSYGVAAGNAGSFNSNELLSFADAALYAMKRQKAPGRLSGANDARSV